MFVSFVIGFNSMLCLALNGEDDSPTMELQSNMKFESDLVGWGILINWTRNFITLLNSNMRLDMNLPIKPPNSRISAPTLDSNWLMVLAAIIFIANVIMYFGEDWFPHLKLKSLAQFHRVPMNHYISNRQLYKSRKVNLEFQEGLHKVMTEREMLATENQQSKMMLGSVRKMILEAMKGNLPGLNLDSIIANYLEVAGGVNTSSMSQQPPNYPSASGFDPASIISIFTEG